MNIKEFWKGEFGNEYTKRNINLVENNYAMFEKVFSPFYKNINSVIEFGAGSGQNILALKKIFNNSKFAAVEINEMACKELKKISGLEVNNQAINGYYKFSNYDLVLCKGILIHIPPEEIEEIYNIIYNASKKYILLCEYYSPARREIPYRSEKNKLWAFDFIKPMIDRGCKILDYGFVSKYDEFPQDDITWVLLNI